MLALSSKHVVVCWSPEGGLLGKGGDLTGSWRFRERDLPSLLVYWGLAEASEPSLAGALPQWYTLSERGSNLVPRLCMEIKIIKRAGWGCSSVGSSWVQSPGLPLPGYPHSPRTVGDD